MIPRYKNVAALFARLGLLLLAAGPINAQTEKPKETAAKFTPQAIQYFEKQVKPILAESCFRCHGGRKRVRADLYLTSRDGILKGGETGPAVDLEHPEKSLFLKMINYTDDLHRMPPNGKLPQKQIDILSKWLDMGLPYIGDAKVAEKKEKEGPFTEEAKNYWAYQKPVRPDLPAVTNRAWVQRPIDFFILAKLEEKGLSPASPASRIEFIRRATYDLTGLPPTLKEVQAFVDDKSPDAYEKLIDRLLASPHYGEKWGRHWLDVVRFGQTCGYEYDEAKPYSYRYRDYIIKAFNDDKPYNRFVMEQIAGDELPDKTAESIKATGYYRLGVFDSHPADALERDFNVYDDMVSTTSQVMLGMTIGCARCHDHKKDPIPQEDYYRLLAFLRNIRPDGHNKHATLPTGNGQMTLAVTEYGPNPRPTHVLVRGNPHVKLREVEPGFPQILGFDEPEFSEPNRARIAGRDFVSKTARRRIELAKWLASDENPLTARVMVNRIWQHHFGRAIVPTPNDFGKLGESPTHPELLDWLAVEFMQRGWSIKAMHKLIMLSSAYRMSSKDIAKNAEVDPNNNLFWRQNMRRLTAEEIRDSILFVDGTLSREMGGPGVYPELPQAVIRTSSKYDRRTGFIGGGFWKKPRPEYEIRRTIYTFVRRSLLPPMMKSLDLADTDSSCPVRFTTTVPTQSLTLLNSKFMHDHAGKFAARLRRDTGKSSADQVRLALELVTQRQPSEKDIQRSIDLIRDLQNDGVEADRALEYFCLVALNLNEFVYLD